MQSRARPVRQILATRKVEALPYMIANVLTDTKVFHKMGIPAAVSMVPSHKIHCKWFNNRKTILYIFEIPYFFPTTLEYCSSGPAVFVWLARSLGMALFRNYLFGYFSFVWIMKISVSPVQCFLWLELNLDNGQSLIQIPFQYLPK